MVTLLKKRLRKKEEEQTTAALAPPSAEPERDRVLLLVPVEGGFSFQLFAFPTVESVAAYVRHHFPYRADHLVVFRAAQEEPYGLAGPLGAETVVLVRDADRPGVVNLYSFVDMDTANAFIRSEAMRGLPLHSVLLFWAEPIALSGPEPEQRQAAEPPAEALNHSPEQPSAFYLQPIPPVELPPIQQASEPEVAATASEMAAKEPLRGEANPLFGINASAQEPPATVVALPATPAPSPYTPVTLTAPVSHAAPVTAPASPYDPSQKKARRGYVGAPGAAPASATPAPTATNKSREMVEGLLQRVRVWPGWDGLGPHMASAMRLRWQSYEDVRKDEYATGRAWLMAGTAVGAAALAGAGGGAASFFGHAILAAIGAATFTGLIYMLGTSVFGGKLNERDFTLFLQRLGLAAAPGFLLVLGAFPVYGPLFLLGGLLWIMFTSIKATELSLELDRQSAAYTVIFAWLALFAITAVLPNILI